jgi:hypothetical protein
VKRLILFEILKRLNSNPSARRKLKAFLAVGVVVIVLSLGLLVWGTVAAFQFATTAAKDLNLPTSVEIVKSEIKEAPPILQPGCLQRAKGFMSVRVWLEEPIGQTLQELKAACFFDEPGACAGKDCDAQNQSQI